MCLCCFTAETAKIAEKTILCVLCALCGSFYRSSDAVTRFCSLATTRTDDDQRR